MNFKVILFDDSVNCASQAEELNGFMRAHFAAPDHHGSTIVFTCEKKPRKEIIDQIPTTSASLIRLADYQPETILKALQHVEESKIADLYLFPSGFAGAELSVRWAYRTNGSSLTQVRQIKSIQPELIAQKSVYASHLMGTFRLIRKPYCISLARGCISGVSISVPDHLTISKLDLVDMKRDQTPDYSERIPAEITRDMETAPFLIIGGRGLRNKTNTDQLEKLAHGIGAEFGVSRPVAMSAWAPMQYMVGVSGVVTKPEVCIAAAVSGAPAFYVGIENSKVIVAINTDAHAPIMKACDVAVIDDYQSILKALAKHMARPASNKRKAEK